MLNLSISSRCMRFILFQEINLLKALVLMGCSLAQMANVCRLAITVMVYHSVRMAVMKSTVVSNFSPIENLICETETNIFMYYFQN